MGLLWRTIRHLTARQIAWQVLNRLRGRGRLSVPKSIPKAYFLTMPDADKPVSWQAGTFTFLNQNRHFSARIDWNYAGNGKLWTYNLNYFDFLNQPAMEAVTGLALIQDFIDQTDRLRDGLEAYPTSLRLVNWVQFLSRHQLHDPTINGHLFAQAQLLCRRLEYHLAGNHLLENGFALLIGALYFRHKSWFRLSAGIIRTELTKQILADGGHDERSTMYHQILLDRLLTVLLALQDNTWHTDSRLVAFLSQKVSQMLQWLNAVTFSNGDIPLVNDSAAGIAPTMAQLQDKARYILLSPAPKKEEWGPGSEASGYRMFRQQRYELFIDVGAVGPDHQPGHAHADTFSFVLYVDNYPLIVDNSVSTYQTGQRRAWERSTAAHNTVEVNKTNSSEVWGGFRVGRRAGVTLSIDTETTLTACHDGYCRNYGISHERTWAVEQTMICITDRLLNSTTKTTQGQAGIARFYFHPDSQLRIVDKVVIAGPVKIVCTSVTDCQLVVTSYEMADGFTRLRAVQCLEVVFTNELETTILLTGCGFST